jgi:hypothetical protein
VNYHDDHYPVDEAQGLLTVLGLAWIGLGDMQRVREDKACSLEADFVLGKVV